MNQQQPQYQPVPQPSPGAQWGPTSIGLESHIAAGLGYLIPVVGLIFFFIEKTNRFVKFHGAQAILLVIAYFVVFAIQMVLVIFGIALSHIPFLNVIAPLLGCLVGVLYFVVFAFQIWGIIAGFMGKYTKFPIVGDIAERMAGGAPEGA